MTLTLEQMGGSTVAKYSQAGVSHTVIMTPTKGALLASFDGGSAMTFQSNGSGKPTSMSAQSIQVAPECHGRGCPPPGYWWDNVKFVTGDPAIYPHPDRNYYQIYAAYNWDIYGTQLLHYQIGALAVVLLGQIGPVAVAAAIGAYIGFILGGPLGAAIGAVVGVVIAAILVYIIGLIYEDEASTIWWWVDRGFITAMQNIPWWCIVLGPVCEGPYANQNLNFGRVGNMDFRNNLGLVGP